MLFRIIRQPTPTFLQDYVRRIALISATDQPTIEQVLSSSIRRVSSGDNTELQLKTFGKPTSVTLDVQEQTKRIVPIKLATEMKVELDLSERQFSGVWKTVHRGWTQICSSSPQKHVCRSIYHQMNRTGVSWRSKRRTFCRLLS